MKIRSFLRSLVLFALFGAVLALATLVGAASLSPSTLSDAAASYVPGEVLVKFKPTVASHMRLATVAAMGNTLQAHLKHDWTHVKLGAGQTVETALAAFRNDPNVEYAQPNYIYHTTAITGTNDSQYDQLWAFKNTGQLITTGTYTNNPGTPGDDMDIEPAWLVIQDCSSVVVAVVDTGVNYNQQDLAGNMWSDATYTLHGTDFVDSDTDPMDLNGHGTHVAGIIGAEGNNSLGTTGVCWKASIMAVRVLDARGSGSTATVAQGVDFAVAHGAKVINMSLGGGGAFDQTFSDSITAAQNADVVVVVAAGNAGTNNDTTATYPCNFTQANLVCVAALDQSFALATFSNYGKTSVDVGAPGTNILSTWAGSSLTITDDFKSGWLTSGGGWAYQLLSVSGTPYDVLVDPSTFPFSGFYSSNADNQVYKSFNLAGNDVATLNFYTQYAIQSGDSFKVNYESTGGDPFASGVNLMSVSVTTGGVVVPKSFDITPCISSTCSVGFQLKSDSTPALNGQGAGILLFSITTLALNTSTYNTINGTSMATPEVAGLAVMLRAYNPDYTYADTVNAIKKGGRALTSLANTTTTGNAVDVMKSLAYINPPTGLAATVQ